MDWFCSLLIGGIIGFIVGIVAIGSSYDTATALKLSNVMNASMLDCVAHKIITQEQVHGIESIFQKPIESNFKRIKANHGRLVKRIKNNE